MWPMGLCIFAFLVFIGLQVLQFLRNSGAAIFEKRRYYTFVPPCNQFGSSLRLVTTEVPDSKQP